MYDPNKEYLYFSIRMGQSIKDKNPYTKKKQKK